MGFRYKRYQVYSGSVVSFFLQDKDYYRKTVVKNVIQYVNKGWGAKEYIMNYANYGDNQFRRANSVLKRLNKHDGKFEAACYTNAIAACHGHTVRKKIEQRWDPILRKWFYWVITESDGNIEEHQWDPLYDEPVHSHMVDKWVTYESNAISYWDGFKPKNEGDGDSAGALKRLEENKDKFKDITIVPDITFSITKDSLSQIATGIKDDLNLSTVTVLSVKDTIDDTSWCKFNLQTTYGYNIDTNTLVVDGIEYEYAQEVYNNDQFEVTVCVKDSEVTKILIVPNFEDRDYAVIQYNAGSGTKLYIRPIEEVKIEYYDSLMPITTTVIGYNTRFPLKSKTNVDNVYTNTSFPALMFRTNTRNLSRFRNKYYEYQYDDYTKGRYVDDFLNPFWFQVINKLLEGLNLSVNKICDTFNKAVNGGDGEKLTSAYLVLGVPLTAKRDDDTDDFQEPEILSRILYETFEPLVNNPLIERVMTLEPHSSTDQTVTMHWEQQFDYNAELTFKCNPPMVIDGVVHKHVGHYWHTVKNQLYYKIYDIEFRYTGGMEGDVPLVDVTATEYIIKDEGTRYECKVSIAGRTLPADGFQPFRMVIGKPLSEYFTKDQIFLQKVVYQGICKDTELFGGGGPVERKKTRIDIGTFIWDHYTSSIKYLTGRDIAPNYHDTVTVHRYAITPNYPGWFREDLDKPYDKLPKTGGGTSDGAYMNPNNPIASTSAKPVNPPIFTRYATCYSDFSLTTAEGAKGYAPKSVREAVEAQWKKDDEHGFLPPNDWLIPASRFYIAGVTLCKQTEPDKYTAFILFDIKYVTEVRGDKDPITVIEAEVLKPNNNIIIPIDIDKILTWSLLDKVALMPVSMRIVGYFYEHHQVKEMKKSFKHWVQAIGIALAIAGIIFSGGGMSLTLAGLMETLTQIAIAVGISLVLKLIAKNVRSSWLAGFLAAITVVVGMWAGNGFSMPDFNFSNVTELVTKVCDTITGVYTKNIQSAIEGIQAEMEAFSVKYESAMKDLADKMIKFGSTSYLTTGDIAMLTFQEFWYMTGKAIFDLQITLILPDPSGDLAYQLYRGTSIGVSLDLAPEVAGWENSDEEM